MTHPYIKALELGVSMRQAQKHYFKNRTQENLIASKQAEKAFDDAASAALAAMSLGESHDGGCEKPKEGKRNECDCLRRPDSEGIPAGEIPASPATTEPKVVVTGLDTMAMTFAQWVQHNGDNDETHVITPPVWPTIGVLKAWITTLIRAQRLLSEPKAVSLGEWE